MTRSAVLRRTKTRIARLLMAAAALAGAGTGACGDESANRPSEAGVAGLQTSAGRYSIKVFIKDDAGDAHLIELGIPLKTEESKNLEEPDSEPESKPGKSDASRDSTRKKEQKIVAQNLYSDGMGNTILDTYEDLTAFPGIHYLSSWAVSSCGEEYRRSIPSDGSVAPPTGMTTEGGHRFFINGDQGGRFELLPMVFATSNDANPGFYNWHVLRVDDMNAVKQNCDAVLFAQAQLLCAASKLAEIADAVGPVELTERIIVPPQASEDRFLVRALALETLAAFQHATEQPVGPFNRRCDDNYASHLSGTTTVSTNKLFDTTGGKAPFPGLPGVSSGAHAGQVLEALRPRVHLFARHVSTAGRLVKELVESSVDGSLGQAETLRADKGLDAMWGVEVETAPNSLRGALAALTGRLELNATIFPQPFFPPFLEESGAAFYEPSGDLKFPPESGPVDYAACGEKWKPNS